MNKAILAFSFLLLFATTVSGTKVAGPARASSNSVDTASADAKLVEKALSIGIKEVAESEAAQTKVQDARLKTFADRLVDDHKKANQELATIAAAQTIPVPTDAYPDKRKVMDAVNQKAGIEFERRYIKTMVEDHVKAVKFYERAARSAHNSKLKRFFENKIPNLKAHLKQAQTLNKSINK